MGEANRPRFRRLRLAIGFLALFVALLPVWACAQSYAWPIDDIALVGSPRFQTRIVLDHGRAGLNLNAQVGPRVAARVARVVDLRLARGRLVTTGDQRDPLDTWLDTWLVTQLATDHLILFAFLGGLASIAIARSLRRTLRARPRGECPACGYDLRATPDRCPECGATPVARVV